MPPSRSEGQILMNFAAQRAFRDAVDAALMRTGYSDRSKFIRDAIIEKMERAGVIIPGELAQAPMRLGVGGKPTHQQPRIRYTVGDPPVALNDAVSSKSPASPDAAASVAGKSFVEALPSQKPLIAAPTSETSAQLRSGQKRRDARRTSPDQAPK